MAISKVEEKLKDEILQEINDLLEKENWGDGCERLTVKIVFEGRYNLCQLLVNKKEKLRGTNNLQGA